MRPASDEPRTLPGTPDISILLDRGDCAGSPTRGAAALRRFGQVLPPGRRDRRRGELDEDVSARRPRLHARVHVDLVREPVALAAVARRAGRDDVVPARAAAL